MKLEPIEIEITAEEALRGVFCDAHSSGRRPPDASLMIFCHGFPGSDSESHHRLFPKLHNICSKLKLSSVSFDFRGCGKSDGAAEDFTINQATQDLRQVLSWSEEQGYKRLMICAEGLGSLPVLMCLPDFPVKLLCFFWPVFDAKQYAIQNLEAEDHKPYFEDGGFIEIDNLKVGIPLIKELYELELTSLLKNVIMPCMIQHGAQDSYIPIEHLDLARAYFRNRRIELTTFQDGQHGLPQENHRRYVYYHFQQFVGKYL